RASPGGVGRRRPRRLRRVRRFADRGDVRRGGQAWSRHRRTPRAGHRPPVARCARDRAEGDGGRAVISRRTGYLELSTKPAPEATHQLQEEGYVALRGVFDGDEIKELIADVDRVFDE